MKFETIQQILNELYNNKNLSDSLRFGLLDKAISLATKCDEYQELATYACHDDALGVKDWGRELFQLALDNYEFCYSTENCISSKSQGIRQQSASVITYN
jgi:hypothetical protein